MAKQRKRAPQGEEKVTGSSKSPSPTIVIGGILVATAAGIYLSFPTPGSTESTGNARSTSEGLVFPGVPGVTTNRKPPTSFGYECARRHAKDLSMEEYEELYDGKQPLIIEGAMEDWGAMNWTKELFKQQYGTARVAMKGYSQDGGSEQMALPMEMWTDHAHEGSGGTWSYIQDELFLASQPKLYADLGLQPKWLETDYFQLWPKEVRPANAMLLWGGPFSRSELHIDPYNWTGTNMVFYGTKDWRLFPPGQDHLLYVKEGFMSGFPMDCPKYNSAVDAFDPEAGRKYPKFQKAHALKCRQRRGELMIIPTGWFHQAFNTEETLAVSSQVLGLKSSPIALEEVLKGRSVSRRVLPNDFWTLEPKQQTLAVMGKLPKHVLKRGAAVIQDAMDQVSGKASGRLDTSSQYKTSIRS